ncbi:MAG: chromosomal replication initiator protein DnaA [Verrucomicrobiae bacterium]|nr:chromosomal replication initiator protein DnaA [Verrucomicrobiae bacterium]
MHTKIWKEACATLRSRLSAELFRRWFAPIRAVELSDATLVLAVPNEFSQIWLQENYQQLIRETVAKAAGTPLAVKFVVGTPETTSPAPSHCVPGEEPPAGTSQVSTAGKLNPRYTFEAFVVGPNNHHAHAAALAVAQAPGKAYNPLFLYGGVGLGKTHLMQAIGHYTIQHAQHRRVCYITCEDFTNDFIQAIGNGSIAKFRKKFRQTDVLLIDDIHFLAGKERMQEEFFHTFNTLFDAHKQIVLSSDRPAAEIANLEQRLVSRFEWGLVVDLQPPALETRIAILRKKAESHRIKLPDEILLFLAEKIKTNIRRLEGALIRVAAFASFSGQAVTVQVVQSILRDLLQEEARHCVTIEAIQKKVAEHFDIRLADMTSHRRPKNIAFPRQLAMYLCRELTDASFVHIGKEFGGRDHGTVLHACRTVQKAIETDPQVRNTVSFLKDSLLREQRV